MKENQFLCEKFEIAHIIKNTIQKYWKMFPYDSIKVIFTYLFLVF